MEDLEFLYQPAEVLTYLSNSKTDINITKLAKIFQVCQGNMAKCIKKLERVGLAKRVTGKDNREIKIILTKKGMDIGREFYNITEKIKCI